MVNGPSSAASGAKCSSAMPAGLFSRLRWQQAGPACAHLENKLAARSCHLFVCFGYYAYEAVFEAGHRFVAQMTSLDK